MITVKKSEYNKAKLRKLFGQASQQYIQITDEEAQELGLIEQTPTGPTGEPTGEPTGNTEPQAPTIIGTWKGKMSIDNGIDASYVYSEITFTDEVNGIWTDCYNDNYKYTHYFTWNVNNGTIYINFDDGASCEIRHYSLTSNLFRGRFWDCCNEISFALQRSSTIVPKDLIIVSQDHIKARDCGGAYTINVTANNEWGVYTDADFIHTAALYSTNSIAITVDTNSGVTERTGSITVMSGTTRKMILITQDPAISFKGTWQRGWCEGDVIIEGNINPDSFNWDKCTFDNLNALIVYDISGNIIFEGSYQYNQENNNIEFRILDENSSWTTILLMIVENYHTSIKLSYKDNENNTITFILRKISDVVSNNKCHFVFDTTLHPLPCQLTATLTTPGQFVKIETNVEQGVRHLKTTRNFDGATEDIRLTTERESQQTYALGVNNCIIVGVSSYDNNLVAYEGQCSNCIENLDTHRHPLTWINNGTQLYCNECKRTYDVKYGVPVSKLGIGLYDYKAAFDGGILRVWN